MTPQEIIDNNKLLAEFMGYEAKKAKILVGLYGYNPQRDWNDLMPIVERIENSSEFCDVLIFPAGCSISYNNGQGSVFTCSFDRDTKKQAVYEACVAFVKWHDQNKGGD